jgi:queuine/archaeosine tRNA-ribosyltransferase
MTDDDEDEDEEHEYDHDCQCDACIEYRDEIAAANEPEPEGRIGLVHEHTLDQYRQAIEKSGVLKSIDTTEGEDT